MKRMEIEILESYTNEISAMMFGFGDSHAPNPDTVRLVESIVLKQLRFIVQEALKYTDGTTLKGEELIFMLRHNPQKMRRFVKYLNNKHERKKLLSKDVVPKSPILEFIEKIDETGEFTDLTEFDEVKYERQLRADRISQTLDEKRYLEFCKARCTSFMSKDTVHKNLTKLRLWVDPKQVFNYTDEALDVLAYFAYQTVAEIVDYALLVRMDRKSGTDPIKHLAGSYYTSTMFNGKHKFDEKMDIHKIYLNQPAISVNEIKEVMRRTYTPQAGRLNFGGKLPETQYMFAL